MCTLYVVGVPAGEANDLTRRAARILQGVTLIASDDEGHARQLLAHHGITTPLISSGSAAALEGLEMGDVALLSAGWSLDLSSTGDCLASSAIERGLPVVPIPGPSLPLSALVVSGLPADSFVYVGDLPAQRPARGNLLASLAAERRTLVVTVSSQHLPSIWSDLHSALGDRPLIVALAAQMGTDLIWRGTLGQSPESPLEKMLSDRSVLVVGGAREQLVCWDQERLQDEILKLRLQGLGASMIGRQLAAKSGWSRRDIYRLAAETTQPDADQEWDSDAESEPV